MEELLSLLRTYYNDNPDELILSPWSFGYSNGDIPPHWKITYDLLSEFSRDSRIIEVGCGVGDITVIPCSLGFSSIVSYERSTELANAATRKINILFNRTDVVKKSSFPEGNVCQCDVLLVVNCVYTDNVKSHMDYLNNLRLLYTSAGSPTKYILEVIDSSYSVPDPEFPEYIRVSEAEVRNLFPSCKISSFVSYQYPTNRRTKKIYLIEK